MYKFLIMSTLLLGLMALAANVITSPRRPHRTSSTSRRATGLGPMLGVVRAPLASLGLVGDKPGSESEKAQADVDKADKPGKVQLTEDEWKGKLSPEQYQVTRCSATERPFTGEYWDHHEEGTYTCVACGRDLFLSTAKFDSGSGWPSYYKPVTKSAVTEVKDISYGVVRTEIVCSRCESHLGHVFPDGPRPTGLRYCINSAALEFRPAGAKASATGTAGEDAAGGE